MTSQKVRTIVITLAGAYAVNGLFLGEVIAHAIPAMNQLGAVYYAATWPAWIAAGSLHTPSPPIPNWCFTFHEAR